MNRTKPEAPDDAVRRETAEPNDHAVPGPGAHETDYPHVDRGSDLLVIVTVTRTGGIAGMRRIWRAEAGEDEASPWIERIKECPWDAVERSRDGRGADRFMWAVDARCGEDARKAELADSDVRGPWRELIDAVRAEGAPVARERD